MTVYRFVPLLILGLAGLSQAQSPSPGQWQISVESRAAEFPMALPPVQVSQCLRAADAKDPSKLLGNISSPGAQNCTYSDRRFTGNSFHFAMSCAGSFALKATGDVSFTPTSLSGTIVTAAQLDGQAINMDNVVTAQRTGDCAGAAP